MLRDRHSLAWIPTLLSALALMLGTAACGDSDEPDQSSSGDDAASRDGGSTGTSGGGARSDDGDTGAGGDRAGGGAQEEAGDRGATSDDDGSEGDDRHGRRRRLSQDRRQARATRRAKALVGGVYQALRTSDVGRVCDSMTVAARRATAKIGPGPGMSCEEVLGNYYAYAERDNPKFRQSLRARVISAQVDGGRATVMVRFPSGRRRSIELVLVDGRWRLPAGRL